MHRLTRIAAYGLAAVANQVLLIRKGRGPFFKTWDLPGAGIEFGEDPVEVLSQGIYRETGLPLLMARLLTAHPHNMRWRTPDGDMVDLFQLGLIYRIRVTSNQSPKPDPNSDDTLEARWFDLPLPVNLEISPFVTDALLQLTVPSTPSPSQGS